MILTALAAILVAYLPGAVLYRLPIASRPQRAALSAEERLFWQVAISLAWSLTVVLVLAALGAYRLDRVLIANGLLVAAVVGVARFVFLGTLIALVYRGAPGAALIQIGRASCRERV